MNPFDIYQNKKVLITGHTGFKGSWLTAWLHELGAEVAGYSLPSPPTSPSLFELCGLGDHITPFSGDVSDYANLREACAAFEPEIIFHMAAQPLVLPSFEDPVNTFDHNVMGTIHVLEAARHVRSVRAVVCITTDKVYENKEWLWGYREEDRLGGKDPYSASKAMAELAIQSYRQSFFRPDFFDEHGVAVASARAGNVIGGGDFAPYRLVPDCLNALSKNEPIVIRNPNYVRPWQHVLVPLSGYLTLGEKLLSYGPEYAEAWNFGPLESYAITTSEIADKLIELWGSGEWITNHSDIHKKETGRLRLSWEKAEERLGWRPAYSWTDALDEIVSWHKAFLAKEDLLGVLKQHIHQFQTKLIETQA